MNHWLWTWVVVAICLGGSCSSGGDVSVPLPPPTGKVHYRKSQPIQFHYPPLDLDAIKPLFPYRHLKTYRITDTISLKTKLDWGLFHRIFQDLADPPPYPSPGNDLPRYAFVELGEDYLYSYLDDVIEDWKPVWKFDIVTVYSKRPDTEVIYYLPYDSKDNVSDYGLRRKGVLSSHLLWPTLAEWAVSDTASDEVFSEFLIEDWLKRTSVHRSYQTGVIDSLIAIYNLNFFDLHTLHDEARYRNGIEIESFENAELRKLLRY